ncbi:NADP-dependent oxidoreductase [Salinicola rhizosphaerae]|uniref:NADPH:quinone reductase n=1 Tax=Salinicola rhizosphaerae TaxID=1443141 RepID=A0ABQ3E6H2_9GAMM|nr:NADP-dependent oxidoreductase [Salinicola rhizosphaerae]GHB20993.1 NADPH:quinone reductase [Salinicola rhizosphaerae]
MSSQTMNAVRQYEVGGPEVLRYESGVPLPTLKPGEVLVRVRAIGLNPPDWYLREGYRELPPEWQPELRFPLILGSDISGVIAAVAEDVEVFAVGDEVYAMVRFPEGMYGDSRAYAEYVSVPVQEIARKPASLDHRHAAGAPMSLLTAWQFLIEQGHDVPNPLQAFQHRPVPLSGRRVLVNGAAGGVGHFALQLAKNAGAHVTAVASGRHRALLEGLGVDAFIDYTVTSPEDEIRDLDLVVDAVGGKKAARFLPLIKSGGALFPIYPLGLEGADAAQKRGVTVSATQVRSSGAQLEKLAALLDDGSVRVVLDSVYPLSAARAAHERAGEGHIQGKIVLEVS